MNGLFLQGGGAKGAFQAGVLYALNERGFKFNVLTATSIGAMNGYYVLKKAFEEMKEVWLSDNFESDKIDIEAPIIENLGAIQSLKTIQDTEDDKDIAHFYINYVPVIKRQLSHEWSDLCYLKEDKRFERIRQSALLPKGKGIDPMDGHYSLSDMAEGFQQDLCKGVYDGYTLDGGLLNNLFLEPFLEKRVDKLIMIVFKVDFKIPQYIKDSYDDDQLIVISPEIPFEKGSTMNFSKEFIKKIFNEGYEIGQKLKL